MEEEPLEVVAWYLLIMVYTAYFTGSSSRKVVLLILGVLFSLEREEDPSWQVPQRRRLSGTEHCPGPGPTHLLTLAARSSRPPSMAVGETSKVALKVI